MIDFSKDYILENDYVRLLPLELYHFDDLLPISLQKDIWKYSFINGEGEAQLREYFKSTLLNRQNSKEYPFVVYDKLRGEFIGCTRLYDFIPSFDSIRIGFTWYCEKSRGTKVNKSCKFLLFKFLFEEMCLNRIGLGAYAENIVSIKAIESVGCTYEGRIREFLPNNSSKIKSDAVMFSILKSEWQSSVKKDLLQQIKT